MRERNARKAFPKKLMPIQLFCFQSANGVRLIRARRAQEKLVISKNGRESVFCSHRREPACRDFAFSRVVPRRRIAERRKAEKTSWVWHACPNLIGSTTAKWSRNAHLESGTDRLSNFSKQRKKLKNWQWTNKKWLDWEKIFWRNCQNRYLFGARAKNYRDSSPVFFCLGRGFKYWPDLLH